MLDFPLHLQKNTISSITGTYMDSAINYKGHINLCISQVTRLWRSLNIKPKPSCFLHLCQVSQKACDWTSVYYRPRKAQITTSFLPPASFIIDRLPPPARLHYSFIYSSSSPSFADSCFFFFSHWSLTGLLVLLSQTPISNPPFFAFVFFLLLPSLDPSTALHFHFLPSGNLTPHSGRVPLDDKWLSTVHWLPFNAGVSLFEVADPGTGISTGSDSKTLHTSTLTKNEGDNRPFFPSFFKNLVFIYFLTTVTLFQLHSSVSYWCISSAL